MSPEVVKGLFGLGGTFIGAIIGALFKGWYDAKNRDYRELLVIVARPIRLIVMSEQIASRVEVRVDGQPVPALASCQIQILNTGNRSIKDVDLVLRINGDTDIVSVDPIEGVGRSIDKKHYEVSLSTAMSRVANVRVSYINAGETIDLKVLVTNMNGTVEPEFRQEEVKFVWRKSDDVGIDHPFVALMFAVIKQNWLLHIYMKTVFQPYRRYLDIEKQEKSLPLPK